MVEFLLSIFYKIPKGWRLPIILIAIGLLIGSFVSMIMGWFWFIVVIALSVGAFYLGSVTGFFGWLYQKIN